MLTKQTEINYKDYTVSRQVIDGVVQNLLKLTRIEDPDIIYSTILGNSNLTQGGATVGQGRKADFGVKDNQVLLEVTEKRSEENRIMRGLGLTDIELPLFRDPKYNIGMFSNSVEYEVELEIQLRHSSRSRAEAWTSDKMSRIESGLETFVTEGDFHYHIPATCFKLARDVLTAAKKFDPSETRTPEDYFKEYLSSAVTVVTDQAGKSASAVATHRVSRVEVIFENGSVVREKDEKGTELGGFVSRISCNFKYTRPETIMLRYPPLVNGEMIDKFWWYDGTVPGLSDTRNAIATPFIEAGEAIVPHLPLLSLPRFLQGIDYKVPEFVTREGIEIPLVVTYLDYTVPQGDATALFNLAELGDLELGTTILDYLKLCVDDDQYLESSVISIYLIVDGRQVASQSLAVSPDLTVWYNGTMTINKTYQVVITINPNLTGISDDSFDILRRSPTFLADFLADFYPDVYKRYKHLLLDDTVNASDLAIIIDQATADPILRRYKQVGLQSGFMVTVLNGRLIAH